MLKNTHPQRSHPSGRHDSTGPGSPRSRRSQQRHLSVRGDLRDRPDVGRITRAFLDMEMARFETEARAEAQAEAANKQEADHE